MAKKIISIFCFFLLLFFLSGKKSEQTNCVIVKWKDRDKLSWSSYNGAADSIEPAGAASYIGIRYKYLSTENKLVSYAFFDCNLSWVKEYAKTQEVFKHELYHFNIAEIGRRILMREVSMIKADNKQELENKIEFVYRKTLDMENDMHNKYDLETDYSNASTDQKRWIKQIDTDLHNLNIYESDTVEINCTR